MDPISLTTAVVASLQVACSVLSCCYSVRADMRKLPWTLIQIIDEVRDLRNLLEAIEPALGRKAVPDAADLGRPESSQRLPDSIEPVIASCLVELQTLEDRIRPRQVDAFLESKRKAMFQSLSWRIKGDEAKESIASLQRCKAALNLAISSHNSLVVRNIERLSVSLDSKMNQSYQRVDTLARDFNATRLDEQPKAVVDWLSPLKPGRSHHLLKTAHQPGTSAWFQEGKDFQEWLSGRSKLLWLSGPPGSGKTVMMSNAIESISGHISDNDDEAIYAFVYCDFRDPDSQNMTNILGAALSQLCTQLRHFPNELLSAYKSSMGQGHSCGPAIEMISETIETVSAKRETYLFIDGIDEVGDCKPLADHLVSLAGPASCVHILVSSRNEVAIQRAFADFPRVCLDHHTLEVDQDIERYVLSRFTFNPDLGRLSPEIQSLVSRSLLSKSKGAFRWAACQIDSLSQCRTIRDIKTCLQKLPEGLNATYGGILRRSAPSDVPLLRKIMTWLAFSSVPIKLQQLCEALAIEKGRKCIDDESRLRSPQDILVLGNSLITTSSDGCVMLAHLSVRDYLLSSEIKQDSKTAIFALDPGACHMELAQYCLTYLFFSNLSSGPSRTQEEYLSRLRTLPLLQYATKYWFHHARNAQVSHELQSLTTQFFSPDARENFMSWVQVFNANSPFKWNIFPMHATSLYYAASLGLDRVVESLLKSATLDEINAPGSRFGGTAIHAAIIRNHLAIVRQLIAAGGDLGKSDFN